MNGTQKPLDIDLNAEWEKACASFANSSKGKQLQGRATATPAQVAEAFTKKAKSSENSKKWEKLGTIAANTGFALLRLGEVASQAASMVGVFLKQMRLFLHTQFVVVLWSQPDMHERSLVLCRCRSSIQEDL